MKINIKPLSVNEVWMGRRFKTEKYKQYERDVLFLLPKLDVPSGIKLKINLMVSFSNPSSDLDNIAKPFIDILQKKYGFNDSQIYYLTMIKRIVKVGFECIEFDIKEY